MAISTDPIDQLRSAIRGDVVLPGVPAYDDRRRTFNAMLDRRPRLIVRPRDTDDVVAAVRWAAANDLSISVRGGGHSVAGHGVGEDALMIDLGGMRSVRVDPERKLAEAGGGALLEDLDTATTAHGLGAPSGTYMDTGVGGLTLSGGIGFLLGIAGFACDALVGAEVVTASGEVLQVDEASDPELLWALRGGGGNFGVVTRFRHALVPLTSVYGGRLHIHGAAVPDMLRRLFDVQAAAPDELTLQGLVAWDAGAGLVGHLTGAWVGDPADGSRWFTPFQELPGVVLDEIGVIPYLRLQSQFERMGPTYRHYWKAQFLRRTDDGAQAAILDAATRTSADSGILVEPIHGKAHRLPDGHAAFGGRRALANVSALGIWSDPAEDDQNIAWSRATVAALQPFSLRDGGYLNYAPDDEPAHRVEQAFGTEAFGRLRAVKRRLDPDNRFRFNANIPPA
jgi:FAD/FMN-containing dehydrogenase